MDVLFGKGLSPTECALRKYDKYRYQGTCDIVDSLKTLILQKNFVGVFFSPQVEIMVISHVGLTTSSLDEELRSIYTFSPHLNHTQRSMF